jgi:hypothetical protein
MQLVASLSFQAFPNALPSLSDVPSFVAAAVKKSFCLNSRGLMPNNKVSSGLLLPASGRQW